MPRRPTTTSIITSGGVSVGEEDPGDRPAVEAEGRLDMWKIGIKPGKPPAFGAVTSGDKECAFIGLPGNPVSAFVTFLTLVRPFVLRLSGVDKVRPKSYLLRADYEWARPDARREFLRALTNDEGGRVVPESGVGRAMLVRSGGRPSSTTRRGRQWRGVIWCASFRSPSC
ncbi:MAG: molybdopterin-binding protein [Rhodocyclaceae bacterium]